MSDTGKVNIHGKSYLTVALRVSQFREEHRDWCIATEIIHRDDETVVMKASIYDEKRDLKATGHSEEKRAASQINRTSALENAETSAIGRALAALGYVGTEFASADEVANAITQQKAPQGDITPNAGAGDGLPAKTKQTVLDILVTIKDAFARGSEWDAYSYASSLKEMDEKLYLWSLLNSKERAALKRMQQAENKVAT